MVEGFFFFEFQPIRTVCFRQFQRKEKGATDFDIKNWFSFVWNRIEKGEKENHLGGSHQKIFLPLSSERMRGKVIQMFKLLLCPYLLTQLLIFFNKIFMNGKYIFTGKYHFLSFLSNQT